MATRIWRGDAVAIAQVVHLTVSGTWAQNDTASFTLNGKTFEVTIGTLVTTAQVATTLAEAWNGTAFTDTSASVDITGGGSAIAEMAEITASTDGSDLILTADTAGKPFDNPTTAETTAGDGALGSWSTTTSSDGPNDWSTADNWDGDTVPVNSDDVIIPEGAVSILYGLDQSAVTLASLTIEQGFTGTIGLPEVTASGYDEYRDTYLRVSATDLSIGEGNGNGSSRIKIDVGSNQTTANISNSGQVATAATPAILLKGSHASNAVNVLKGSVGIAALPGETATVATLRVGYLGNQESDSRVELGDGVTLTNIEQSGGQLGVRSNTTLITNSGGTITIHAGRTRRSILTAERACIDRRERRPLSVSEIRARCHWRTICGRRRSRTASCMQAGLCWIRSKSAHSQTELTLSAQVWSGST
jgi:hypothetical protein